MSKITGFWRLVKAYCRKGMKQFSWFCVMSIIGVMVPSARTSGSAMSAVGGMAVDLQNLGEIYAVGDKATVCFTAKLVQIGELKERPTPKNPDRKCLGLVVGSTDLLVQVALWTPVAEKVFTSLMKAYEASPDGQFPDVICKKMQKVVITTFPKVLCKVQSSRDSSVAVGSCSPLKIYPNPAWVVSDFRSMVKDEKIEEGVQASLQGRMYNIEDVVQSRKGDSLVRFILVDCHQNGIPLTIHGPTATSASICEGRVLTIVSALARAPLGESEEGGAFWAYDEDSFLFGGRSLSQKPKFHCLSVA